MRLLGDLTVTPTLSPSPSFWTQQIRPVDIGDASYVGWLRGEVWIGGPAFLLAAGIVIGALSLIVIRPAPHARELPL